jgi:alanine-synthesizing transaminase
VDDVTMQPRFTIDVSHRIRRLPPYLFGRLNEMKHRKRQQGIDIIDLGMGNPNDPAPAVIVEKLCEAAANPRNHRYSTPRGVYNLRREVARHYQAVYGVDLDPAREVIATIGSKEGFSHMCLALLGPGDTALVPNPAYPPHIYGVALAGANVISVPVADPEEFLRSVVYAVERLYPRPKVLVINYPHNPTTATVEVPFFEEVVALARRFGFLVIHDFAYAGLGFEGYEPPSFLQVPGAREVGVEFTTMSKAYNMAGFRLGFCAGHREMIDALASIKGYYDYGVFQAVQIAGIIALRHCRRDAREQARVYQGRRDVLVDGLRRIGWRVEPPRASMFLWAPVPEEWAGRMGSIDFALKLMDEAEVAVAPGRGFGEAGEGCLRFALVENENRLRQAVRQIGRCLRRTVTSEAAS